MKINRIPPSKIINQYIHLRENMPTENKAEQSTDKVELTKDSKTFSAALKSAREAIRTRTPEELKKINEVAKMIQESEYSVSGEDVAAKMLDMDE